MKHLTALLLALLLALPGSALAEVFAPSDAAEALQTALELCSTCAFAAEYGGEHSLMRWDGPIRIYLDGQPSAADRQTLADFILQLCYRVPTMPNVTIVDAPAAANVTIWYGPLNAMGQHVTNYQAGNWGYFTYWYSRGRIVQAEIGIATDVTTQRDRNHLLQEELVGALGLTNDHDVFSDSILYQPWTTTQQLSEVDWLMLNMLYHPDVTPGCAWEEFRRITEERVENR